MFDGFGTPRDISESTQVSKIKDRAAAEFSRFEDAWVGLTWLLARDPEKLGVEFRGCRIYKHRGVASKNPVPTMVVIFEVRESVVDIIDLQIYKPEYTDYDLT